MCPRLSGCRSLYALRYPMPIGSWFYFFVFYHSVFYQWYRHPFRCNFYCFDVPRNVKAEYTTEWRMPKINEFLGFRFVGGKIFSSIENELHFHDFGVIN